MQRFFMGLFLIMVLIISSLLVACGGTPVSPTTPSPPSTTTPTTPSSPSTTTPTSSVTLKFTTHHAKNATNISQRTAEYFFSQLEKRSEGRIKIEQYLSASLSTNKQQHNAIKTDAAQVAFVFPSAIPSVLPYFQAIDMLYAGGSPAAGSKSIRQIYELHDGFKQPFIDYDMKPLFFVQGDPALPGFSKSVTKDIRLPSDIAGLKIRSFGMISNFLQTAGATPVTIAWTELPEALQRGTAQGAWVSPTAWTQMQLYELVSQIVYTGPCNYASGVIVMKDSVYESLPKDLQQIIDETREDTLAQRPEIFRQMEGDSIDLLKTASNLKLVSLTDAEKQEWKKIVPGLWEKQLDYLEESGIKDIRPFFDQFQDILAECEQTEEPWYDFDAAFK
ncbi:TRAP transporter substrate-binding protein [Chloroflexota bacterium]